MIIWSVGDRCIIVMTGQGDVRKVYRFDEKIEK
jgi:hypothetical protein